MLVSSVYMACTNDDVVVRYSASTPSIDTAKVAETQITYGDTIHVNIAVSDKVAPLSTLALKVVVNNEVVVSETIRTKGNQFSVSRKYAVPFVANRPDNSVVKVYLSQTNVTGITKDSIVGTTIAKRPPMPDLWLIPSGGKGIKMTVIDAPNLVYKVTGLTFGPTASFKIASKVTGPFQRIDTTGIIFGKIGDGIGVSDKKGDAITVTDATLVGVSEITFDALKFTVKVGGKLLEPVKTLDMTTDLLLTVMSSKDFRGGNVYFGENVEVTFTGITTDLANSISPDYFEVTGAHTAKFLGKTGVYKAYFLSEANYLYIEPVPEALYPDVLWICGTGFGRPSTPYVATASWNWNSPLDYMPCRLVSTGIYQATMYCKNTPSTDTNIYGGLDFKFFHKRGWWDGHETWVDTYTLTAPFLGPLAVGGNVKVLSGSVVDGVYRITVDTNTKTFTAVKIK